MRNLTFVAVASLALVLAGRPAMAQSDPTGFTAALNAVRAQRGLPMVGFDATAQAVAMANNQYQLAYGLGHYALGGMGQCSAVGLSDAGSALSAWLGSPAHAALLLDPDLRAVGCAGAGGCWTASTSVGGVAAVGGSAIAVPMAATVYTQTQTTYTQTWGCQPTVRRGLFGRRRMKGW